jgi:hypothetical protein
VTATIATTEKHSIFQKGNKKGPDSAKIQRSRKRWLDLECKGAGRRVRGRKEEEKEKHASGGLLRIKSHRCGRKTKKNTS